MINTIINKFFDFVSTNEFTSNVLTNYNIYRMADQRPPAVSGRYSCTLYPSVLSSQKSDSNRVELSCEMNFIVRSELNPHDRRYLATYGDSDSIVSVCGQMFLLLHRSPSLQSTLEAVDLGADYKWFGVPRINTTSLVPVPVDDTFFSAYDTKRRISGELLDDSIEESGFYVSLSIILGSIYSTQCI